MMIRRIRILAALSAVSATLSFGSMPLANLSTNQAILLDGHRLEAAGVSSWPMVLGDDVTTGTSPATISFQDGSSIKLDPLSRVKITGTAAQPRVILVAGKMDYRLAPGSELTLANGEQDPNQQPTTGAAKPTVIQKRSKGFYFLLGSLFAAAIVGGAFLAYALSGSSSNVPLSPL